MSVGWWFSTCICGGGVLSWFWLDKEIKAPIFGHWPGAGIGPQPQRIEHDLDQGMPGARLNDSLAYDALGRCEESARALAVELQELREEREAEPCLQGEKVVALDEIEAAVPGVSEVSKQRAFPTITHPEAVSNRTCCASDPFSALWNAGCQCAMLIAQVAAFATETSSSMIWPWPMESVVSLPGIHVASFRSDFVNASNLAWEALPPAIQTQLQTMRIAVVAISEHAAPWLTAFTERFPEQRGFEGGREPAIVLLLFLILISCSFWQLYGLWRFLLFLTSPCRWCCRRSRAPAQDRLDGEWEVKGGASEAISIQYKVLFEPDVGEGVMQMKGKSDVVLSHGGTEIQGRLANGLLRWETGEVWSRRCGAMLRDISSFASSDPPHASRGTSKKLKRAAMAPTAGGG